MIDDCKGTWIGRYVDLYSALDDNYLVLKALRHGSPANDFSLRSRSPDGAATDWWQHLVAA